MTETDPTRVAGSDPRPSGVYRLDHQAPGGPKVEPVDTPAMRRATAATEAAEAEAAGVQPAAEGLPAPPVASQAEAAGEQMEGEE